MNRVKSNVFCFYCGCLMRPTRMDVQTPWGEDIVTVENAPCYICDSCGHVVSDPETAVNLHKEAIRATYEGRGGTNGN